MKKMPTLFKREFEGHRIVRVTEEVAPGLEWVLAGEGVATEKVDGAACALIGQRLYKRYDAKGGQKRLPDGAIRCQPEPDPVTGHWPHWVPVDSRNPGDKWFVRAWCNTRWAVEDGTYEAVGPHFQGNPYGLDEDFLERHGRIIIRGCPRTYEGIREYLRTHEIEGIVWWKDGEPRCKIKRSDFGFEWPMRVEVEDDG